MLGASGAQRLDDRIEESFDKFSPMRGGHKNDYYGLLFFETVLGVSPEIAIDHIAFGGNDFGIDGFYADRDDQQFRLFHSRILPTLPSYEGRWKVLLVLQSQHCSRTRAQ